MALARLLQNTGRLSGRLNSLQLRLAAYLARSDEDARQLERIEAFKDMVLAFNPAMYKAMFSQENKEDIAEQVEQLIPETEGDVQRMLSDLARLGL